MAVIGSAGCSIPTASSVNSFLEKTLLSGSAVGIITTTSGDSPNKPLGYDCAWVSGVSMLDPKAIPLTHQQYSPLAQHQIIGQAGREGYVFGLIPINRAYQHL